MPSRSAREVGLNGIGDEVDPSFQFGQAATFDFDGISNRALSIGVRWNFSQGD